MPEVLTARVGEVVSVTVPNWGSAGFIWQAHFDPWSLHLVDRAAIGPDRDWPRGIRFSFRVSVAGAHLRLELRRPGAPVRETRLYVVGAVATGG